MKTSTKIPIYIYDTISNAWRISPYTLPASQSCTGMLLCKRKDLLCGGVIKSGWVFTDYVDILDLATEPGTAGSPLPLSWVMDACNHYKGKLYWIGGGHTLEQLIHSKPISMTLQAINGE